jgi:hypothetical protein
VGYTLSFSFQSLKVAIVEALTAHAATVAAAVTGAPAPSGASGQQSGAGDQAPQPSKFTLFGPSTAAVGTNMTLSVTNGTPNGTFAIYEDGIGSAPSNISALTINHPLDATGAGQIAFAPLTSGAPIGAILNDAGSIDIYAADSAGNISNSITIESGYSS